MSRKGNKILIACLALLLALSVGYALFSDNITVSGTAVSDAEFDMVAACEPGVSSILSSNGYATGIVDKGYENDTCVANDSTVNINIDFTYPGAQRTFTIKTTNKGNLDAKLDMNIVKPAVAFCYNNSDNSIDATVGTPDTNETYISGTDCYSNYNGYVVTTNGIAKEEGYTIQNIFNLSALEDENGNILTESELEEFYDKTNNILILKPNYSAYFTSSINVERDGSYNTMNIKIATKVTLPFEQAPIQ